MSRDGGPLAPRTPSPVVGIQTPSAFQRSATRPREPEGAPTLVGFLIGDSADSDELLSSTVFCGGHGEAFLTARPPAPRSGFPTAGGCPRRAPGGGRPSVGSGCGCRAHGRHRAPGPDLELPQMPRALGPPAPASRPPTLQATPLTPVISTGHQHGAHCFAVISSGSRKIFYRTHLSFNKKKKRGGFLVRGAAGNTKWK